MAVITVTVADESGNTAMLQVQVPPTIKQVLLTPDASHQHNHRSCSFHLHAHI